ncbi:hypothetical protein SRHO_G00261100 [Serrasalmus rhombeus]
MAQAAKHLRKNKDLEALAEQERKEKEEKKEEERAKRRSRSRDKKRKSRCWDAGGNRTCCKHTLVHVRRKEGKVQPNEDACVDQTAFEFHTSLMQAELISVGHEPESLFIIVLLRGPVVALAARAVIPPFPLENTAECSITAAHREGG